MLREETESGSLVHSLMCSLSPRCNPVPAPLNDPLPLFAESGAESNRSPPQTAPPTPNQPHAPHPLTASNSPHSGSLHCGSRLGGWSSSCDFQSRKRKPSNLGSRYRSLKLSPELFISSYPHLMEIVIEVGIWKSLCWRERAFHWYSYRSRDLEKPVLERAFGGYSRRGV